MKLTDYISGSRSGEEANRIERKAMRDPFLYEALDGYDRVPHDTQKALLEVRKEIRLRTQKKNRRKSLAIWSSVASILLLIIAGSYYLFTSDPTDEPGLVGQDHTLPAVILPADSIPGEETLPLPDQIEENVPEETPEIIIYIPPAVIEEKQMAKPHIYVAGTGKVFGMVTDETGEPLIGASVVVAGTTNGIITDIDGYFELQAELDKDLQISYIGYETLTIPIQEEKMQIAMREDNVSLEEVVVTGYGTVRKSAISAAVTTIKEDSYYHHQEYNNDRPIPVDGNKSFRKYLQENKQYQGKAKVVLHFTINRSGRPENIQVKKSTDKEAADDAVRLIQEGPNWRLRSDNKKVKYTVKFKP